MDQNLLLIASARIWFRPMHIKSPNVHQPKPHHSRHGIFELKTSQKIMVTMAAEQGRVSSEARDSSNVLVL